MEEAKLRLEEEKKARKRSQGIKSIPKMLDARQRRGAFQSEAQTNLLVAREQRETVREEMIPINQAIRTASSQRQFKDADSKYKILSKKASRIQQVIDNPGDFFWENGKWQNKRSGGGGGGGGASSAIRS
jgi:hypothetical protein